MMGLDTDGPVSIDLLLSHWVPVRIPPVPAGTRF